MRRYRSAGERSLKSKSSLRLSQYENSANSEDDENESDSDTYETDVDKLSKIIASYGIEVRYLAIASYLRSYVSVICDCLQKPALFVLKLNSILLPQLTGTLNIYPSPVYQVLNVNWSAFVKGILPTLQSHGWNNRGIARKF